MKKEFEQLLSFKKVIAQDAPKAWCIRFANNFMRNLRAITPVVTGRLRYSWRIANWRQGGNYIKYDLIGVGYGEKVDRLGYPTTPPRFITERALAETSSKFERIAMVEEEYTVEAGERKWYAKPL